jgi:signal peptidase I
MEIRDTSASSTPQKEKKEGFWDLIKFAILALLIVVPIRTFIAQPFIVSGSSMVPTFENNDYLIVDELSYRINEPHRGDVVIFKWPKDTTKYFIKRIIGLPGETVKIAGNTIIIKNKDNPDGFILNEPYVKNKSNDEMEVTLPENQFFVMGDNRSGSADSRAWGTLPRSLMVGKAFLRLFPFTSLTVLPGNYHSY